MSPAPARPEIVVIGSLNHDLTIHSPRLPRRGETVLGTGHHTAGGGKGANQALAAAKLGSQVLLIGAVGDDDHGRGLVQDLAADGVDTSGVALRDESPTGLAVITVDRSADNTIVVSPGANLTLTPGDLAPYEAAIRDAAVVLAQLEVPIETVRAAAGIATGTFLLNPAPAQRLPQDLLDRVDLLVPNRSELALLAGLEQPVTGAQVVAAVTALGVDTTVVVTLGEAGALVVADGNTTTVPAPAVEPVDPTGAGDAFCGALAHGLATGLGLLASTQRAVAAGALAATKLGAQPSMPTLQELERFLGR